MAFIRLFPSDMSLIKLAFAAAVAATAISSINAAVVIISDTNCPTGGAAPSLSTIVEAVPTGVCFALDAGHSGKVDCQITPGQAVLSMYKDSTCTTLSQTLATVPADGSCGTIAVRLHDSLTFATGMCF
jgi:hypothetical protein